MPALPPDFVDVLVLGLVNPATVGVGYFVGRKANEAQKLVLAGFMAGIAGAFLAWIAMLTGLTAPKVRLLGGVFVVAGVAGIGWAWLGYMVKGWMARD